MPKRKWNAVWKLVLPSLLALACAAGAAAQSISGLSVTLGPVSTPVTITGTGFGATQGTSTVTFNGAAATATSWSDTSINVTVPASATTGPVIVTISGTASNSVTFTVTPYISSLSLTTGPIGMGFVITGTTFGNSQGSSTVTIGSTELTVVSNEWSDTSITVALPAGAATGNVVVTVSNQASNGATFTVVPPFGCGT